MEQSNIQLYLFAFRIKKPPINLVVFNMPVTGHKDNTITMVAFTHNRVTRVLTQSKCYTGAQASMKLDWLFATLLCWWVFVGVTLFVQLLYMPAHINKLFQIAESIKKRTFIILEIFYSYIQHFEKCCLPSCLKLDEKIR